MKTAVRILAALALGLTVLPPCLRFTETISGELQKQLMLAGALLWFATATPLTRWRESSRPPQPPAA
jgi:hypothetical protein